MSPYILFLFFLSIYLSQQCGMITHNEISQRAFFSFKNPEFTSIDYYSYIASNQGYFEAASAFPDWGYLCQSPAGELNHWPPFLEAYKQYFLDNYSLNSSDSSHLLAFLFGIMSHDESDVLWHWGRQNSFSDDQGFLHSMSHDSSDCLDAWNSETDPTCHTIGDTGGDFFLAYRGSLDWLDRVWRVPTYDLSQIYKRLDLNISEGEIGGCMAIMFIGALAERIGSGLIFEYYGKHTAFLAEEIDLWFMGGIDDMAINTQWKWIRMIQELEERNSSNVTKDQDFLFRRDFPESLKMNLETLKKYGEMLGVNTIDLGEKGIEIGVSKENLTVKAFKNFISELKRDLNITIKEDKTGKSGSPSQRNAILQNSLSSSSRKSYLSSHEYSYFSKSFTSGKYSGSSIITFVSAPGYSVPGKTQTGAIYMLQNIDDTNDIDYENPFWKGPDEYSRCGWSMQTLDINHDGLDDLIVSCPTYGPGGVSELLDYYPKSFFGKIFVFFGRKDIGIISNPDISLTSKDLNDTFNNLGFQLSRGDCNNDGYMDLIIGSPFSKGPGGDQIGKVHIIEGLNFSNFTGGYQEIFIEDVISFQFQGDQNYEWFGYSSACYNDKIIIGAPGGRTNNSNQASGKVFEFKLLRNSPNNSNFSLNWEIDCNDAQAKFGLSMALNNENSILAIGASSFTNENGYKHAGKIFLYNLSNIEENSLISADNFKSAIAGSASYARFGNQMVWNDNDLIVGSPQYGDILGLKKEKGAIFIYKNAGNFENEINYENYDSSLYGISGGGRFGAKLEFNAELGKLFVGSPWSWNVNFRLSGGLHIFDIVQNKND